MFPLPSSLSPVFHYKRKPHKTQYFYTMIDNTTFIKYNNTNIFFKKEMMSWTPVPYAKLLFC